MRMLGLPIYVDTYHAYFEIHKGGPNRAGYVEAKHWLHMDETAGMLTLYIIDEISMVPELHYLDMRTYI